MFLRRAKLEQFVVFQKIYDYLFQNHTQRYFYIFLDYAMAKSEKTRPSQARRKQLRVGPAKIESSAKGASEYTRGVRGHAPTGNFEI